MEIKTLITVFKAVLEYYENYPKGHYCGICGIAWKEITPYSKRTGAIYLLFGPKGYYMNFVGSSYLRGPSPHTRAGTTFRIAFLKQEIIELQNLLSEGYTDV